jgi:hypothetical protein
MPQISASKTSPFSRYNKKSNFSITDSHSESTESKLMKLEVYSGIFSDFRAIDERSPENQGKTEKKQLRNQEKIVE